MLRLTRCRQGDPARPDAALMTERYRAVMTEAELVAVATALAGEFRTSETCIAGDVAAAIVSSSGRVYTGVCVDTGSSMGFCAEHAAIAELLKARESSIALVVAVSARFGIIPPCGRCRELMWQVDPRNRGTRVIVGNGQVMTLEELLPQRLDA